MIGRERRRGDHEKVVDAYFAGIRELRQGEEGAAERLRDLWDEDGVFEFVGAPPVTGTFAGRNAIFVLYKNRFRASGMTLTLESDFGRDEPSRLGAVDTEVTRMKATDDDRIVAAWTTTVATADGRGFQVSGSHAFTFREGRIVALKVVVSPRPEETEQLRIQDLTVDDIGRLALAAWPVV